MNGEKSLGAGSVFGDAVVVVLVLNELRHRAVEAVFGVRRQDANPMTVIAAGLAAESVNRGVARVLAAGAIAPVAAAVMGGAALKETAHAVAGPASRSTPYFVGLVALAGFATSAGPLLRGSVHGVHGSLHAVAAGSRRLRAFLDGQPSGASA